MFDSVDLIPGRKALDKPVQNIIKHLATVGGSAKD